MGFLPARSALRLLFTAIVVYTILRTFLTPFGPHIQLEAQTNMTAQTGTGNDIKLEVFIMSHCPDAEYTITFLHSKVLPHFSRQPTATVGSSKDADSSTATTAGGAKRGELQTSLEFITRDDGTCKHGHLECLGNRLLLSVQHVVPTHGIDFLATYIALGDLYKLGTVPSDDLDHTYADPRSGPISAEQQAEILSTFKEVLPPDTINVASPGVTERGGGDPNETLSHRLLKISGDYAKSRHVVFSATVLLDGSVVAIRDDNQWRSDRNGTQLLDDDAQKWIDLIDEKLSTPTPPPQPEGGEREIGSGSARQDMQAGSQRPFTPPPPRY